MIVCLCHRISERDIATHVTLGCASFDTLQDDTRVGTACGCCLETAKEVFAEQRRRCRAGLGTPAPAEERAAALA